MTAEYNLGFVDIEARQHIPGIVNATSSPYQRIFPLLRAEVLKFCEPQILLGSPSWLKQILDDFLAATRRPCLEDLMGHGSENNSFDQSLIFDQVHIQSRPADKMHQSFSVKHHSTRCGVRRFCRTFPCLLPRCRRRSSLAMILSSPTRIGSVCDEIACRQPNMDRCDKSVFRHTGHCGASPRNFDTFFRRRPRLNMHLIEHQAVTDSTDVPCSGHLRLSLGAPPASRPALSLARIERPSQYTSRPPRAFELQPAL